jgi:hypothetical protein
MFVAALQKNHANQLFSRLTSMSLNRHQALAELSFTNRKAPPEPPAKSNAGAIFFA